MRRIIGAQILLKALGKITDEERERIIAKFKKPRPSRPNKMPVMHTLETTKTE